MGLRIKLAGAFVILLTAAVLAASLVDLSYNLARIANEIVDSGNVVASEVFEQVRAALARAQGEPVAGLRADQALRSFIQSVQAFGTGIVFISVNTKNGENIVGQGEAATGQFQPAEVLSAAARLPLP